ncbi:putative formin-like protein 3-like [Capsicum annuum]|nr:putative formin-like protein 3-like [Capsicum annuum]KAF3636247.1 putative formin-like protein 3-like [Capsicum annuum]
MRGAGRGKSGRGGAGRGRGRGSFAKRISFETTSNPQIQPVGVIMPSLETGQSSNPSQGLLQTELSHINKRKGRGKYKSKTVDFKIKHRGKIKIMIPNDIDRAVCSRARDIVNYCGFIMRTTISFRDGNWQKIVLKYGEAMWLRVRRNPLTGEKETPDKIWEIQHTRKNINGERGQLQQLVVEQQSEEINNPMTSDEILSSVLGVRLGYFGGKGYGKKPPKKSQTQQANIEASVSSTVESMRQEMQLDIERKLQEEREQMAADLKRQMDQDLQKKLEEEREHMKGEVEKIF